MAFLWYKLHISPKLLYLTTSPYIPHPTPTPRDGVSRSKIQLSEHVHVAYQIKKNRKCSNMVAKIFCRQTPPTPSHGPRGWGQKKGQFSTLSEHIYSAYQIKENQGCSSMVSIILPTAIFRNTGMDPLRSNCYKKAIFINTGMDPLAKQLL